MHRRYLVRRWAVVGGLALVTAVVCVVWFTPVIGVRAVEVTGVVELTADQVRDVAGIVEGTPLVRLDTDEITARVRTLPRVGAAVVTRSFPGTVEIAITERTPVAVRVEGDGAHLLDAAGVDYGVLKAAPPGLPLLETADPNATRAVVAVLAAVPPQLAKQVVSATARTPGDIRLNLVDGRTVKWGDDRDNQRKVAVLGPLLTRDGKVFDVAAPELPTVS